jgi:hypothetical protein
MLWLPEIPFKLQSGHVGVRGWYRADTMEEEGWGLGPGETRTSSCHYE